MTALAGDSRKKNSGGFVGTPSETQSGNFSMHTALFRLNTPCSDLNCSHPVSCLTARRLVVHLTAAMFNFHADSYGYQLLPIPTPISFPTFPGSNVVATQTGGPYPVAPVVVTAALIGSWTA